MNVLQNAIRTITPPKNVSTFHKYLFTVVSVVCIVFLIITRLIGSNETRTINRPSVSFYLVKVCFTTTIVVLLMWRYLRNDQLKMCFTLLSYIFLGLEIHREYELYSFSVKYKYYIRDTMTDYSSLILLIIFMLFQWVDCWAEEEKPDEKETIVRVHKKKCERETGRQAFSSRDLVPLS